MTPVETLRAAERELREAAKAATPGPWVVEHGTDVVRPNPDTSGRTYFGVATHGALDPGDAAYIALLDPRAGLALADWLNWAAVDHESAELGYRNHCTAPDAALTFARLILGAAS